MRRGAQKTFFQRQTTGQLVYENIFNIFNHQGNANQNRNVREKNIFLKSSWYDIISYVSGWIL